MNARDTLVLLAGGQTRRLPRKLELDFNGEPLLVRAVRTLSRDFDIVVSLAHPLPTKIARRLDCRFVFDRYEERGPLGGMLAACELLECYWLAFLAADLPFVDAALMIELRAARREGDDAVLASHDGRIEPLVGWYDRRALLHEGRNALERGDAAVHRVVERLHARFVPMPSERFANVNTADDLETARNSAMSSRS